MSTEKIKPAYKQVPQPRPHLKVVQDKPGDPRDKHSGTFNLVSYNESYAKPAGIKMVQSPKPPKEKPTPTKQLRYHVTGSGRDPLPLATRLGTQTNYNSYVDNLRGYNNTDA